MTALPTVLGFGPIPMHLQQHNCLNRQIIRELRVDQALKLEYPSYAETKDGQRALLMAGMRELGANKVQTAVEGTTLHIWLRAGEPSILEYLAEKTAEASHE